MEMESYLGPTMNAVAQVGAKVTADETLELLTYRLDRLESKLCGGAESSKLRRPFRYKRKYAWNAHALHLE